MNRSIKLIRNLFLLACVAAAFPSYAQSNAPATASENKIRDIDGVAAVVNTGFVTRKEIDDRIAAISKQGGGSAVPDKETLRKQVLERLIVEKIQLQDAEQSGISVSNAELDKIIADIAARNKLSMAEFRATIQKSGSSFERYREMLRDDIIVTRFREREVDSQIKISDAEVDNYISERTQAMNAPAANAAAAGGQEELDVAQIFIPVDALSLIHI